ncbi:hypothetical protein PA905_40340 [Planktothrix agardhii CCAP 1459/11A]|uniref:Uncharacterized protein n=1 Tax=Planktothrix agardhii CCAP 1459/11A TaxID=282420 RepID=A0A4P5ZKF4_PLAAG|nr:hypothetical protein PA905_40340 [Planktothrix agardhii CCAP 1459/11A]CAD5921135.1 hypothetical protein PCC7821_00663 [Planktothrix rubescens NIVA-CYA 18]CAD5945349.1 hypothetical protein NO108_02574 [Planktothrix rubescens]CAD5970701.1 hypothetical protein NO758_03747 [Planktothrix agardhii]CAH2571223.1 hypothetical protein PRNO82_00615 [Planktothrix rubescens]
MEWIAQLHRKSCGIRHRAFDLFYGAKSQVYRDDAAFL